jgi:DNA repair photolyase
LRVPTHSYLGLSPGLDFESKLFAKVNAAELLRRELAHPGTSPSTSPSASTPTPTNPASANMRLTRQVLEVLSECQHPVGMITKSSLIERDIDLLAPMAAKGQACAAITITTLDSEISRTLEPRAAAPARRLRTIRTLTEAGIPVSVSVAPIIPFVTEPEIERILEAARDAGAVSAHYTVLRLPFEVNPLFQQWLEAHFPERAQRVMNRVREMRGGKDYDSDFGKRMHRRGRLGRPDPPALHQDRRAAGPGQAGQPFRAAGYVAIPAAAGGAGGDEGKAAREGGGAAGFVLTLCGQGDDQIEQPAAANGAASFDSRLHVFLLFSSCDASTSLREEDARRMDIAPWL